MNKTRYDVCIEHQDGICQKFTYRTIKYALKKKEKMAKKYINAKIVIRVYSV